MFSGSIADLNMTISVSADNETFTPAVLTVAQSKAGNYTVKHYIVKDVPENSYVEITFPSITLDRWDCALLAFKTGTETKHTVRFDETVANFDKLNIAPSVVTDAAYGSEVSFTVSIDPAYRFKSVNYGVYDNGTLKFVLGGEIGAEVVIRFEVEKIPESGVAAGTYDMKNASVTANILSEKVNLIDNSDTGMRLDDKNKDGYAVIRFAESVTSVTVTFRIKEWFVTDEPQYLVTLPCRRTAKITFPRARSCRARRTANTVIAASRSL